MPEESRTRRFAILIDADNTSPRIAAGLFEEVAKFGEASVRRIYGDFSGQREGKPSPILDKVVTPRVDSISCVHAVRCDPD